ncbi:TIM barrel protein [Methanococcus voltae]|uniref:Xylose isomerase domain protein TIM barrel n=1 Tax=Methanococcus voltae (strain ATCC BAA-1334 / A3) TaxID=456320 RepID=D7DUX6_METV3|nr:TIM barrel protein [Methanococcus voltae]MCS3900740.1 deoxyribonuclease-4 [Methanococcus voltae]
MIKFGTAGIPIGATTTETSFEYLKKLELDAMELEFVRSVHLKAEKAKYLSKLTGGISLSAHAPYYVNLNAKEDEKINSSIARILKSCEIMDIFAKNRIIKTASSKISVVYHAGFYLKQKPEEVYEKIKNNTQRIINLMDKMNYDVILRPETTGKLTQFGTVEELTKLSNELGNEYILPCIDFSHVYARSLGKINNYEEFCKILEYLDNQIGKKCIKNMHMHVSGIEFGKSGEKKHYPLENSCSEFNYKDLLKALKDFKVSGTIICESPCLEKDALILKKYYKSL